MAVSEVSLKLLIDTKNEKLLFAEASKDFIDFLFNLLSLPMGQVVRLLRKKDMVGCLPNLYKSIENLNETYIQPNASKDVLLKPKAAIPASVFPLLLTDVASTTTKVYICSYYHCSKKYGSNDPNNICPSCNNCTSTEVMFVDSQGVNKGETSGDGGGHVKGVVTYMVMDDLVVTPMSTISSISLLNKFNIQDVGALQEKNVTMGMDEGLQLLKESLQSKSVLTNTFLKTCSDAESEGKSNIYDDC